MERNYWVRTEHGRIWGPYSIAALERLRGQLTEKCEASVDGKEWHPGVDFPELRSLLVPARKVERQAPMPPAPPRISKAMTEAFAFGTGDVVIAVPDLPETPAAPADARPASKPRPPPPRPAAAAKAKAPPPIARPKPAPPPAEPEPLDVPASGDLAQVSPTRLYGLAALTSATGLLRLDSEKGGSLRVSFRRGTPEHLASDDPDLSLLRYLQSRKLVEPEKAVAAEEQAAKSGQDIVSVLFQMQLIAPSDAHMVLGEYAVFLLDRALLLWRGTFSYSKHAAPPAGAFPLGPKWALLADSVRRLDVTLLSARFGKRFASRVVRSGGLGIGKVEELGLNAQETRLYAAIDGTRSGEELLRAHDPGAAVRLLYLLAELGHLGFTEVSDEPAAVSPPPAKAAPPPPPIPKAAPAPAPAAAPPPRELPKTTRQAPRPAAAPQRAAAPPVLKPAAAAPKPAAPALAVNRPPPTFAQGPADETPEAALTRLSGLWEKLATANHFEVLGMERKMATAAESKRNFFVLAKELHPDTVTDPAQAALKEAKERLFARINEAAQVLGDEKRRKEYESELDGKAENVDVSRIFAAEENFHKAVIFIKARKYQEGLELLEQAIQMNGEEAEFYAWRGYARFLLSKDRKQSFEECASDCRKAIKMVDRCLPAHLFLGHMAKILGDPKLAKKCYMRVLELDEKHVEAQREMRLMKA